MEQSYHFYDITDFRFIIPKKQLVVVDMTCLSDSCFRSKWVVTGQNNWPKL